ncbi:MAG: SUMF1/EgtB/PvdO family nonheme iron enzyme [Acidobacteria bacterium]|nr:SUMF1/EgtB/PvdO family nonheme iron enzyme [Acidobacteriota bacterium]
MNRKVTSAIVLILAGCLILPLLSRAQQQRGQNVLRTSARRTALVIGNSNYQQGPLRNPVNDARAIGNTLKSLGFDVTLLFDQNLRQMDEAVRTFGRKIKGGGIGLFYFAGHGVQVGGVNYLVPAGARVEKEQDMQFETLEIGKVTAEMEAADNGLNIVILDACRNNPFTRSFRSPSPGLAPINAPSGTYIAFATAPGTTASDGEGENGLYTQELLLNLTQPGLRLEDVFIRTRVAVKKKSNDKQVPWENGALEGVVILNGKEGAGSASVSSGGATTTQSTNPRLPSIQFSGVPLSALRSTKFMTASVDEKGNVKKREAGPKQYYLEDLGNGVKLEMVAIPGGRFQMGSPVSEPERDEGEIQHWVQVSSFWMGRYEVTQAQWRAVMGRLPHCIAVSGPSVTGDDLPVTCVSWSEVKEFITELNETLKLDNEKGYGLPREAEWEYAARAGTTTPFPYGPTIAPELENYNWDSAYANGPKKPSKYDYLVKVGSFVANPFGLFDMLGNATEWCEDWLGPYPTPRKGDQADPTGPSEGERRVVRGGAYGNSAFRCRSADRAGILPNDRTLYVGFRLVRR